MLSCRALIKPTTVHALRYLCVLIERIGRPVALRNAGEAVRDPHENPPLKCGLQRGRDNRYEEEGGGGELIPNPRQKHRERRLPNL